MAEQDKYQLKEYEVKALLEDIEKSGKTRQIETNRGLCGCLETSYYFRLRQMRHNETIALSIFFCVPGKNLVMYFMPCDVSI